MAMLSEDAPSKDTADTELFYKKLISISNRRLSSGEFMTFSRNIALSLYCENFDSYHAGIPIREVIDLFGPTGFDKEASYWDLKDLYEMAKHLNREREFMEQMGVAYADKG